MRIKQTKNNKIKGFLYSDGTYTHSVEWTEEEDEGDWKLMSEISDVHEGRECDEDDEGNYIDWEDEGDDEGDDIKWEEEEEEETL